jgi:hypothetical protein
VRLPGLPPCAGRIPGRWNRLTIGFLQGRPPFVLVRTRLAVGWRRAIADRRTEL